jgi:hypothetical protein
MLFENNNCPQLAKELDLNHEPYELAMILDKHSRLCETCKNNNEFNLNLLALNQLKQLEKIRTSPDFVLKLEKMVEQEKAKSSRFFGPLFNIFRLPGLSLALIVALVIFYPVKIYENGVSSGKSKLNFEQIKRARITSQLRNMDLGPRAEKMDSPITEQLKTLDIVPDFRPEAGI